MKSLSIGIAAYNEEANIGKLLDSLTAQQISSAKLQEIIVVSDGSTDATDSIVKNISDPRVKLIRHQLRMGSSEAQNTIMRNATGDVLAINDGDVLPEDQFAIERIIAPIINDEKVGLTSGILVPAHPQTFIEKILARNHIFKRNLYKQIDCGNNIYTCFGPARAFNKSLYKDLVCPRNVPIDAFSYMSAKNRKFNFVSSKNAHFIFRCPSNLKDHEKQSTRFLAGKKAIIRIFGVDGERAYFIPSGKFYFEILKESITHPIFFTCYAFMVFFARSKKTNEFTSRWEVATSSKKIWS